MLFVMELALAVGAKYDYYLHSSGADIEYLFVHQPAVQAILGHIATMQNRRATLGMVNTKNGWQLSKETFPNMMFYQAAIHVATNLLTLIGCLTIVIGHGQHTLPSVDPKSHSSFVLYWTGSDISSVRHRSFSGHDAINISRDLHSKWQDLYFIRFVCYRQRFVEHTLENEPRAG